MLNPSFRRRKKIPLFRFSTKITASEGKIVAKIKEGENDEEEREKIPLTCNLQPTGRQGAPFHVG